MYSDWIQDLGNNGVPMRWVSPLYICTSGHQSLQVGRVSLVPITENRSCYITRFSLEVIVNGPEASCLPPFEIVQPKSPLCKQRGTFGIITISEG